MGLQPGMTVADVGTGIGYMFPSADGLLLGPESVPLAVNEQGAFCAVELHSVHFFVGRMGVARRKLRSSRRWIPA